MLVRRDVLVVLRCGLVLCLDRLVDAFVLNALRRVQTLLHSFCSCEPPLVRLNRVNDIICESQSRVQPCLSQNSLAHNSHSTSARSLHAAHNSHARMSRARCVVNSEGDTEDGRRLSCVSGGTKSLSTCTRTGVRRPAADKLASPQQASLKLHDEMWAGLPMNLGPRIFREVEIIPGCAVRVACPSCPDYYS